MYPKTRGRVLAKTNPRERKSGRGLRGLERSGKERICKGKPLSRCQRVAGPSAFCFGPETDQRINDEPDILIRGGKFSREPEECFFFLKIAGTSEDRSASLDNFGYS